MIEQYYITCEYLSSVIAGHVACYYRQLHIVHQNSLDYTLANTFKFHIINWLLSILYSY